MCCVFFVDMAEKDEAMEALKKEAVDLVLFPVFFFILFISGVDCSSVFGLSFVL